MKAIVIFLATLLTVVSTMGKQVAPAITGTTATRSSRAGMTRIRGGSYRPFLQSKAKGGMVHVKSYYLDIHAVTNEDFLQFVKANPEWARSKVTRLFADQNYLRQWLGDLEIGDQLIRNSPVTNVSWFAASAYAKWKGKRLPTESEWEYAASIPPVGMKKNTRLSAIILEWYDHPTPTILPPVQSTYRNSFGVYDLHGLIWEWVADFNSIVTTDEGSGGSSGVNRFSCAAGSLGAADKENYAAFMRYAFRASLQASFTVRSLGFRCACDEN